MSEAAATPTTATTNPNIADAATPPAKVTDMVTGGATAANDAKESTPDPAKSATEASPETAEEKKDEAPAPAKAEPSKLDRARAAARAKYEEAQRRAFAQRQQERQQLDAQRALQYAQQQEARARALEQQLQKIQSDPLAALSFLEQVGLPPKVLAQKAVEASTPEAKLKADLEQRVAAQVAEVRRDYEARFQQIQAEREAQAREAQARAARQAFISDASNAEQYPAVAHLVSLGDEWKTSILGEATRVLEEAYRKTGYEYTNEEVLDYLNKKYSKIVPTPKDGADKSNGVSTTQREAQNGTGSHETNTAGSPRTMTNKATQLKGSLPPNFDDMSDRDQKAALAALYRQSRRA